eukprot:COSAG01_NODE_2275_length_8019_cov_79.308838_2_plen_41_part_00
MNGISRINTIPTNEADWYYLISSVMCQHGLHAEITGVLIC